MDQNLSEAEIIQNIFDQQKQNQSDQLIDELIKHYFGNEDNYLKEKSQLTNPKQVVCAKGIESENELSFKCYDCGRENEFHMFCEKCFLQGNHYKHRIQYSTQRGGCCDCGDSSAISEDGFCYEHPGYKSMTEDNAYKKLSKTFRKKINIIIKLLFQEIFKSFESFLQSKNESFLDTGNQLIKNYYNFVEKEVKENVSLIIIVSATLLKTLKTNQFYHNCEKIKGQKFLLEEKHNCFCTILENLFRFNDLIGTDLCERLEHQIYTFFPNFQFKKSLVLTYVEMYQYLVSLKQVTAIEKVNEEESKEVIIYKKFISDLRPIYTQFFDHYLQELFLFSSKYEEIIYDLKTFLQIMQTKQFVIGYECYLTFINMHFLFQNQKVALKKKIMETNLQKIMLEQISSILPKNAINYKQQIYLCHCEMLYYRVFSQDLILLENLEQNQFSNHLFNLLKDSLIQHKKIFQEKLELDTTDKFTQLYFLHQNSYKIFGILCLELLHHYKENISIFHNELLLFIQQQDPQFSIIKKIFKKIYQGIATAHFIYDSEVKSMNTSDYYFQHWNESPKKILDSFYFYPHAQFYDKDLATTQLLSLFLDINWILEKMFKYNFQQSKEKISFKESSVQAYQDALNKLGIFTVINKEESKKQNLEKPIEMKNKEEEEKEPAKKPAIDNAKPESADFTLNFIHLNQFLEQLIYFVVDDIAILNQGRHLKTEYQQNNWMENSMKFIIIQMFSLQGSYKYQDLKQALQRQLLAGELKIDKYLTKVANLNQETKQFTLKPQYQNLYEPYLFYKMNKLSSQLYEQLEKNFSKNESNDMIIGTKNPHELNSLFYQIQEKYIQSNLLYFISAIILNEQNLTQIIKFNIMKNALKLLHLITQFIQINNQNQEVLIKILARIQQLKQQKEMIDFIRTLTKIEKEIHKILHSEMKEEKIEEEKTNITRNKFSSKQQDILNQYKLKQTAFVQKNTEIRQILDENETKVENICVFCHADVNETQWGYIGYIATDNLSKFYYESNKYKQQQNMEIEEDQSQAYQMEKKLKENQQIISSFLTKESKYNYIINNCQHVLHQKCYYNLIESNQAQIKIFGKSEAQLSYFCPICQMMANTFIPDIASSLQIPCIEIIKNDKFFQINTIVELVQNQNYSKNDFINKPIWAKNYEVINEFSTSLMMLIISQNEQAYDECSILTILESLLLYQIELILTDGFEPFLKNQLPLCSNLMMIYSIQF